MIELRYLTFAWVAGILFVGVVEWVSYHHPPRPRPIEKAYGKGDLLFIHRDPPPAPLDPPPPAVEPPAPLPTPTPTPTAKDVCERSGGVKIADGRSWHCHYSRRRR